MIAERRFAASKAKASAALKMSVTTFEKWLARGMPRIEDGGYDLDECEGFIRAWKQSNNKTSALDDLSDEEIQGLSLRYKLAETLKMEEDARAKRLKNDELEGRLIDADDERQQDATRILRIKSRLEAIPEEMQSLAPAEVRPQFYQDMANFVHQLLMEMSGWE